MIRTTLDGVPVLADDDGAVSVLGTVGDDGAGWARADELVRAGWLARRDYGPDTYGASVYHLAPDILAELADDGGSACWTPANGWHNVPERERRRMQADTITRLTGMRADPRTGRAVHAG